MSNPELPDTNIDRYVDIHHHDTPERHIIERIWGTPPAPSPPGTASPGNSFIPARADHVHPGGTGSGTPKITFNRVGVTAVAASDYAWIGYPETKPAIVHRFLGWSAMWRVAPTATNVVTIYQNDTFKYSFTFAAGETRKYFEQPTTGPQIDGYSWGAPGIALSACSVWSCVITTAGTTAAGLTVELFFAPHEIP